MTTLASDAFTGTGALSANWTTVFWGGSTAPSCVSDQLSCPTGAAGFCGRNDVTWPDDQMARMVYRSGTDAADNGSGPAVRINTAVSGEGYFLQVGSTDTRLYVKVGTGFTQLGTTLTSTPSSGDILEIRAIGTTITAKINGSNVCGSPVTDSSLASGDAGFWFAAGSAADIMDDWEGADSSGFSSAFSMEEEFWWWPFSPKEPPVVSVW